MPAASRKPKIQSHVTGSMRDKIRSGHFKPGDRLPSYSAMMAEHGVSTVTVDRIYNSLEQEGLIVRKHGRGTFVAHPKSAMRKACIGLCAPLPSVEGASGAYWTELRTGIMDALGPLGPLGQRLTIVDHVHAGIADHCDGLLLMTYQKRQEILNSLPPGFPLVSVVIPRDGFTSVVADDAGGIRQAVEHLLALGHRRFGFFSDGSDGIQSQRRAQSFQKTLAGAGIPVPDAWIRRGEMDTIIPNYLRWGREQMNRWLAEDWWEQEITALVAQNDEMAVGAMQALTEAGIRIPDEVSVAGYDGTVWGEFVTPTLTSVEMPLRQMGRKAAELLLGQIGGEPEAGAAEELMLPTHLIVRNSTRERQ